MIRNRTPQLIQSKHRQVGRKFTKDKDIMIYQPWWFEQYYNQKQILTAINANNRNITMLARQYQVNPSVYILKQVEKIITDNCKLIEGVDRWVNTFRYSPSSTAMYTNEKTLTNHMQMTLAEQIMNVFQNKQIINSVNNQLDHQASFSRSRVSGPSPNNSFTSPNMLNASFQQDRNRLFMEVNSKIEDLNVVMRRMNVMVAGQGELVNRIDENLKTGKQNMVNANVQLNRRHQRQEGTGQFSLQGKANKVISVPYKIKQMLGNWIFRQWRHNRTYTKLIPIAKIKQYPFWALFVLSSVPIILFSYSYFGIVNQFIPNLQIFQNDRERLLLKRRAFDTLIMAHKQNKPVQTCQAKSLF